MQSDNEAVRFDKPRTAREEATADSSESTEHLSALDQTLDPHSTIVIVGTAARLPGGVRSAQELWDFIVSKRDGVCTVPPSRYNIDGFQGANLPYSVASSKGYFLQEDPTKFDAEFFNLLEQDASLYDPQLRLLFEVIWECFENAGQTRYQGEKIGCYLGVFGNDWMELMSKDQQIENQMYVLSTGNFALSNIVSYQFDLRGPGLTIETGCSASTAALHNACQALKMGDCSAAIVAGSNLIMSPTLQTHMGDSMAMSPHGVSRSFDALADGYGRGEGVNAILVKTLHQAQLDGDRIRAVVRGTSMNSDGKSSRLTTPSSHAQKDLVESTYRRSGITDLDKTAFVECHGTGTQAGDIVEASAVAQMFSKGIHIGSVKPNFGHSEGASGITSILKCIMALENRIIPPNTHFKTLNPKIQVEDGHLLVPTVPTPWPQDRADRVSVNNFGVGGANSHVILESASHNGLKPRVNTSEVEENHTSSLLVVSAQNEQSLQQRIQIVLDYLAQHPDRQKDLVYTLGVRRTHLSHRAFATLPTGDSLNVDDFQSFRSVDSPEITLVFTGQGAQWPGMGKELLSRVPVFGESIRSMDEALQKLPHPPSWTIKEKISVPDENRCSEAEFSQPLTCAIQIGIVDILTTWGLSITSAIGHSSGEIAAAYAAGAIDQGTAIRLAYYRGQCVRSLDNVGGMAAIGLGRDLVNPYLMDGVVIGCENSPDNVTLSGSQEKLTIVLENIARDHPDILCRRLRVGIAYHSYHLQEQAQNYESMIKPLLPETSATMKPLFSTTLGEEISDPRLLDSTYWRRNLESPVLFSIAVQQLLQKDGNRDRIFLEVGPHPALSGPLRQIFARVDGPRRPIIVPTLVRGADAESALLGTVGNLFGWGVPINFQSIHGPGQLLVDIPPYPWHHKIPLRKESSVVRDWRLRPKPHHELLGSQTLESTNLDPTWRNVLSLSHVPWLTEHRVQGRALFPGAGYVAMAVEALQQTTSAARCQISKVLFKAPLFLDDADVELVTSLRRARISDTLDSEWWEFSITSRRDDQETKHCTGQIRPVAEDSSRQASPVQKFPRTVSSKMWYSSLHASGLEYGPRFRGMDEITADPVHPRAAARVTENAPCPSRYLMHPVAIDKCLHVISVAMLNGLSRNMDLRCIPASLEGVEIGPGGPEYQVQSAVVDRTGSTITGKIVASANEQEVLSIEKSIFVFLHDRDSPEDRGLASQPVWKPHLDFLPTAFFASPPAPRSRKIDLVDKFASLYIQETFRRVKDTQPCQPHLQKYKQWLKQETKRIQEDFNPVIPSHIPAEVEDLKQRLEKCEPGLDAHTQSLSRAFIPCLDKVLENSVDVLEGQRDGLEVLMEDDNLREFYEAAYTDENSCEFFSLAGHSNPAQRVLEVGAGTGAGTAHFLRYLHTVENVRLYSQYVFTDISSGFFAPAREKFNSFGGIDYQVLDITVDPSEQGFVLGGYDLIVASNVIHATPCLHTSLANLQSLLAPGGRLFLQEGRNDMAATAYVVGLLPGWWLGEEDGRADQPNVSVERWEYELCRAGFSPPEFVTCSDASMFVNIVASVPPSLFPGREKVHFLVAKNPPQWTLQVQELFESQGYNVTLSTSLQDTLPTATIVFLDLDHPFVYDMGPDDLQDLQHFISSRGDSRTVWVTKSSQLGCTDPRYGLIYGLSRTLRAETGAHFSVFEVDHFDTGAASCLLDVYENVSRESSNHDTCTDFEFSLHNGMVHVERYYPVRARAGRPTEKTGPVRLSLSKCGLLDSFVLEEQRPQAPGTDEVEVAVKCIGLNFRDVIVALGLIHHPDELGCEGSGLVQRVGPGVSHLKPGDKVIFICNGGLRSRITLHNALVSPMPDMLSFDEAATLLLVYMTVIYGLVKLGGLTKEKSVLIHSACGGVGIAAINICQKFGAQIYATVGNKDKAAYLADHFGIPSSRIFHSRDVSFVSDLMRETNCRGADLVLNSLTGELLQTSLKCVAIGGTLLEIGKRDFISNTMIPMSLLAQGRRFIGVDAEYLLRHEPETTKEVIRLILNYVEDGSIPPISPITRFPAGDISKAFKHMQKGDHIGKIVIDMPSETEPTFRKPAANHRQISPDRAYLLVGGLGGIGRTISNWLVENGATCLVYLSPSAGTKPEHHAFFEELAAQGCRAIGVQGSAASMDAVREAISQAPKPIAGVFQLSLVLKDSAISTMAHEVWKQPLEPKVSGTWNLHHALQDQSLDFFVLFGSLSGAVGLGGQANYGAANTFLTAFAGYRASIGQPASVIDLGVMTEVGYVSRNVDLVEALSSLGCPQVRESDLLTALQQLIDHESTADPRFPSNHLALGLGVNREYPRLEARILALQNAPGNRDQAADGDRDADEIQALLDQIDANPKVLDHRETEEFLIVKIGNMVHPQARDDEKGLNLQFLSKIAIDSLIAIEARTWARRKLGVDIALTEISSSKNVADLAKLALKALRQKYAQFLDKGETS